MEIAANLFNFSRKLQQDLLKLYDDALAKLDIESHTLHDQVLFNCQRNIQFLWNKRKDIPQSLQNVPDEAGAIIRAMITPLTHRNDAERRASTISR